MDLADLFAGLSDPAAYPHPVDAVEVHQTHISVVFLAGPYVYKVKKPLTLDFVDYGTLALRGHFCDQETILNRRLAPDVYLGVVPITQSPAGARVEGDGPVVEWAVKMTRLPADATLGALLQRSEIRRDHLEALAQRIAAFHAGADRNAEIAAAGRFDVVANNARENFSQASAHVGATVSPAVFERARERTERALETLRPTIEARAARGVPCDGHGDLRLDHVYVFPDRPPPADLVIVDCIEFNARFRHADPIAEMAFLDMDLAVHGRSDLARVFSDAYSQAAGDTEGPSLLPFYRSYRAAVRGKVEGIASRAAEVPEPARTAALGRARAHWLLALGALETPAERPCLVLVAGLPGTGKSTLAGALAEQAHFEVIRSDLVRKELARRAGLSPAAASFEEGIYTPEWTERTYAESLHRAEALLFDGRRVLVDASFGREAHRTRFLQAAVRWGVPGVLLVCEADRPVALARLARRRGDASDAGPSVYERSAQRWEPLGPDSQRIARAIATGGDTADALAGATAALRDFDCAPR